MESSPLKVRNIINLMGVILGKQLDCLYKRTPLPSVFPQGLEDTEEVDEEQYAGGHAEAGQGLAGGRAVLWVVVGVEGDDADGEKQAGPEAAQQCFLQNGMREK